jgi:hypothetical protein
LLKNYHGEEAMDKSSFLKIQDVIRFIEDVFGDRQSFEIEGGDAIVRSEGRRAGDIVSVRTFLEQKCSDIVFSVTICDDATDAAVKKLPEVFNNPDYLKVLRNRYREINRTELQLWKIEFLFSRLVEAENSGRHKTVFRFTVNYLGEA